jgi:hypothetical protein
MDQERSGGPEPAEKPERLWEPNDEPDEIRYSLTALGEAVVSERRRGPRFRGFGPCAGMVCA